MADQRFIVLVAPRYDRIVFVVRRDAVVQKMYVQAVLAYVSMTAFAPEMTFGLVPVSTPIGSTKRPSTFSALMGVADTALTEDGRTCATGNIPFFLGTKASTNANFAY